MLRRMRILRLGLPLLLLVACSSDESTISMDIGQWVDAVGADVADDVAIGVDVGPDAVETTGPDAVETTEPPQLPEFFPMGLPPSALVAVGDRRPLRTIIHAHTIYSHDACDGEPVLENGMPNEPCLASFRTALCTDHIDVVMLTEHTDRMAEEADFNELFLHRDNDEWVMEDGQRTGNMVVCEDGHRALILPGLEGSGSDVSPLGMTSHPSDGTVEEIRAAYQDGSPAGLANLRAHGGVPVAIHIESADQEELKTTDYDAIEVGNLHALVAPDLRKLLGLDADIPIVAFTSWLFSPEDYPAPDFVFLEFHQRVDSYHWWWDALLQEKMIAGFAGNDVHQNVLPLEMGDGDRPDSYRRMMKWYVNYLHAPKVPSAIKAAIAAGQLDMVFEVLGSPRGFDARIEATTGDTVWRPGSVI
ncbi:MAG: hypothetical protein ACI9OJ_004898, partial [Myxococcota bacterium]